MPSRRVPQIFAITTLDPGTTSGVARGVFPAGMVESGMLMDVFREAMKMNLVESWEVEGTPAEQGVQIACEYRDWAALNHIQLSIPLTDIHFTCESFELRPNKARGAGSDKNMLDPIRVMSAVDGIFEYWNNLSDPDYERDKEYWIDYQTPQTGHRVSSDRLREYDAWVVGSEHRRDAMRHLLQKASSIL